MSVQYWNSCKAMVRSLHADDRGSIAVGHVVWVMIAIAMASLFFNLGVSTKKKGDSQRPAMAISHSIGVWKARGMNVVASHQHLQGELAAMVVIHQAIGGDALDARRQGNTRYQDLALDAGYALARLVDAPTPYYPYVRRPVYAGATLLKAHRVNKLSLAGVYAAKFVAMITIGNTAALDAVEMQLGREWEALQRLYQQARALTPMKQSIMRTILPNANRQLRRIVQDIPTLALRTANEIAQRYEVKLHIPREDLELPIEVDPYATLDRPPPGYIPPEDCNCPTEPADNPRYQMVKTSQLARATFPWVNYHRLAMVQRLLLRAPLSMASVYYYDEAAGESRVILDRLQKNHDVRLYVMPGKIAPDKGWEDWTFAQHSNLADQHLTAMVLTGQDLKDPMGSPYLFRKPQMGTWVRWDAVMLKNDNPQIRPSQRIDLLGCKRIVPSRQAIVGYDTLAWDQSASRVSELVGNGIPHVFPRVKNAWNFTPSVVTDYQNHRMKHVQVPVWARDVQSVLPETLVP
jgi:hypothetical protein